MIERECLHCQKPFQVPYPSSKRQTCSPECLAARRRRPRATRADKGARKSKWAKVKCPECERDFEVPPWKKRAAKRGAGRIFCSEDCHTAHRESGRVMAETRRPVGRPRTAKGSRKRACRRCGKTFSLSYPSQSRVFCDDCKTERMPRGTGRRITPKGYVLMYVPPEERPPGAEKLRDQMEHRMVMAQKLGRHLLPKETVHHINGDRQDNRPENLELWSKNHGPGQRVVDQLAWAREIIATYEPIEDSLT